VTHNEPVRRDLQVQKKRITTCMIEKNRVGTVMTANQEVRNWLRETAKSHWYFYNHRDTGKLWVAFHSKQDAMLWKLAWH
jgi:hypothetical protein